MKEPTLKDIYDEVKLLVVAVTGDEKMGIKGTNQRLEETQQQVNGHEKRITKLEAESKKFKVMSFVKGIGVGATSASSAFAIGSGKAGAAIAKIATALGAIIFVCYCLMLIL